MCLSELCQGWKESRSDAAGEANQGHRAIKLYALNEELFLPQHFSICKVSIEIDAIDTHSFYYCI